MKNRLAALAVAAFALVALSGCTADAAGTAATPSASGSAATEPSGTQSDSASDSPGSAPRYTTPAGVEVPDGFVEATKGLFAESDPATTFEASQMLCLFLNDRNGDIEQMASLMKGDMGMTPEQTRTLLPLAVEFACPGWADNYNVWVDGGGLDRL